MTWNNERSLENWHYISLHLKSGETIFSSILFYKEKNIYYKIY